MCNVYSLMCFTVKVMSGYLDTKSVPLMNNGLMIDLFGDLFNGIHYKGILFYILIEQMNNLET